MKKSMIYVLGMVLAVIVLVVLYMHISNNNNTLNSDSIYKIKGNVIGYQIASNVQDKDVLIIWNSRDMVPVLGWESSIHPELIGIVENIGPGFKSIEIYNILGDLYDTRQKNEGKPSSNIINKLLSQKHYDIVILLSEGIPDLANLSIWDKKDAPKLIFTSPVDSENAKKLLSKGIVLAYVEDAGNTFVPEQKLLKGLPLNPNIETMKKYFNKRYKLIIPNDKQQLKP